jgi:2-polyprenyl-3-methyl-5-hydroxy-6-metoxy-1,4-benzoquinol methylase
VTVRIPMRGSKLLLRRELPERFAAWNRSWGAPSGHATLKHLIAKRVLDGMRLSDADVSRRIAGPFSLQGNSDTRRVEYPWAYFATPLRSGLRVVEVGGALSGFQFALSKAGCDVVNVDPGEEDQEYWELSLRLNSDSMARLNRVFGTSVELRGSTLQDARFPEESVDRVFSISTIEHVPEADLGELSREIGRILKPGGLCVLTIDLFLDLVPFTSKAQNYYGRNADVRALVEASGLRLAEGTPAELFGYDEFHALDIQTDLGQYFLGSGYPVCAQALVLEKV